MIAEQTIPLPVDENPDAVVVRQSAGPSTRRPATSETLGQLAHAREEEHGFLRKSRGIVAPPCRSMTSLRFQSSID
jgi:hypothetical protein